VLDIRAAERESQHILRLVTAVRRRAQGGERPTPSRSSSWSSVSSAIRTTGRRAYRPRVLEERKMQCLFSLQSHCECAQPYAVAA